MKIRKDESKVVTVTAEQITSGKDLGMEAVCLCCTPEVVYEIEKKAAQRFRFESSNSAITMTHGGKPIHHHINADVDADATRLKLTAKGDAPEWAHAKATLFFRALGEDQPAKGGLDPDVSNGGHA